MEEPEGVIGKATTSIRSLGTRIFGKKEEEPKEKVSPHMVYEDGFKPYQSDHTDTVEKVEHSKGQVESVESPESITESPQDARGELPKEIAEQTEVPELSGEEKAESLAYPKIGDIRYITNNFGDPTIGLSRFMSNNLYEEDSEARKRLAEKLQETYESETGVRAYDETVRDELESIKLPDIEKTSDQRKQEVFEKKLMRDTYLALYELRFRYYEWIKKGGATNRFQELARIRSKYAKENPSDANYQEFKRELDKAKEEYEERFG